MTGFERVEAIVNAVLYEGYMLYPYRPSSVKNRQRWTFGGVFPRDCAATDASLKSAMQTECLVRGGTETVLEIRVRFLHLIERAVRRLEEPAAELPADRDPAFTSVVSLELGDKRFHAWEEVVERTVAAPPATIGRLSAGRITIPFEFPGQRTHEALRTEDGLVRGVLVRNGSPVAGEVTLSADEIGPGIFRLTVRIENVTPVPDAPKRAQAEAQRLAFASTHTIMSVSDGEFISLLDPPDDLAEAARLCDNQGTWPVLAGEEGERDIVLSSPIILYDHPEIAPESPGDLFDATEIDEILTLRILAMTDDEKRDMTAVDERARALLARTEALTAADMARLHGTLRDPRPATVPEPAADHARQATDQKPQLAFLHVRGMDLRVGDRVRLHPKGNADIMDIVLRDEVALIEAIECDFEDKVHVAVVLENDPGREFGLDRMPGHRFFFSTDEIEAVSDEAGA